MFNWIGSVKNVVIGKARNLSDASLFHKTSLIALLAWVGLGADGLSSSCYGPEAAFVALHDHTFFEFVRRIGLNADNCGHLRELFADYRTFFRQAAVVISSRVNYCRPRRVCLRLCAHRRLCADHRHQCGERNGCVV
ncbi:MAG: hypothetical protein WDM76_03575 [Limisphaerales bacterium]